ncbi:calcium-binding protein, partial [Gallibacterium anatis]
TVTIALTRDTGSSAVDNVTNDGKLTLTLKESTDTITKVEVNGTPLQPVDGKYILPEGEYAVGSIVVTSQDASGVESTSQNNKLMIVDTTAPTDAPDIARTTEQGTDISLPIDAKVGDQVLIHIGKDVVTLTKTSDGWQSSNNDKVAIVDEAGTAKGRIPLDAAATGTTVIAQNVDAAGNIGAQITTKSIINPGEVTIVLDKDANFNVDNDKTDQVVLNLAEGERASGSDRQNLTTVPVKAYFPEGTSVGDHYNLTMVTSQFPDGITTSNREITQDMIEKGWSFNINGIDNGQGSVSITLVSDKPEINGKSSTLTVALDKDMPNDPKVHTAEDGSVSVDLPTQNAPYADGSPAKQADVQVGDKVVIKDGDFVATVTKTVAGWESDNPQVTIDGNTAKIASGVLRGGSTVEAQAIDNVGNESSINSAKIVSAPLRVQSLTLTDEHDQFNPTYAEKQSDDRAINFSYQLSGPVDEHTSQYVRIQLFKEGDSNSV